MVIKNIKFFMVNYYQLNQLQFNLDYLLKSLRQLNKFCCYFFQYRFAQHNFNLIDFFLNIIDFTHLSLGQEVKKLNNFHGIFFLFLCFHLIDIPNQMNSNLQKNTNDKTKFYLDYQNLSINDLLQFLMVDLDTLLVCYR